MAVSARGMKGEAQNPLYPIQTHNFATLRNCPGRAANPSFSVILHVASAGRIAYSGWQERSLNFDYFLEGRYLNKSAPQPRIPKTSVDGSGTEAR